MALVSVDLTQVGVVPDGVHDGKVATLDYQIKTGEKWNVDGTETVSPDEWMAYPADRKRLHYGIDTAHGRVWVDLYMKDTALPMLKRFLKACGVSMSPSGFDPEEAIGAEVSIKVETDENGYPNVTKVTKP